MRRRYFTGTIKQTVIPPISTFPPNRVKVLNGGNGDNFIVIQSEMILVENPPISTFSAE